jgi:hypothetical protein
VDARRDGVWGGPASLHDAPDLAGQRRSTGRLSSFELTVATPAAATSRASRTIDPVGYGPYTAVPGAGMEDTLAQAQRRFKDAFEDCSERHDLT